MRTKFVLHNRPAHDYSEINMVWPPFCSLRDNELDAEGGKAIGEALKVNTSITNIK